MKQKLLFVLFEENHCKAAHAAWYAVDLHNNGHEVAIILDGGAVGLLRDINNSGEPYALALKNAMTFGLIRGACRGAATGCGGQLAEVVESLGLPLREGMNGHASILEFIENGFALTVF